MSVKPILQTVLIVLGGTAALAVLVTGFLVVALDLRIELAGNGIRPIFYFGNAVDHFVALEENRSQHYSQLLPAPPLAARRAETPAASPTDDESETAGTNGEPSVEGGSPEPSTYDAYWTDFRGPNRDGRYEQMAIRTDWPAAGLEPVWSQPIGGGYASFVVADGRAFTVEERRDQEVMAAYDVATGRELWTHAWDAYFTEALGGSGPRATPTWHDGRIYSLGATGEFWCLDAETGAILWHRNILEDAHASNLTWAMSAAPLVVDDKVIVLPGGYGGWSVAAYDRLTGEVIWHVLDDVQAYTSPMIVMLGGVRQLLIVTAARAVGLGINDGRLLWEHPWIISMVPNMAQPIVIGDNRVFLSASYGKGAALLLVTRVGESFSVETVWQTNRMKNRFSSSVLLDGYIYGLDESILACIDAATGGLMWKGGRYGYGQLLLAGNHLVVITERGDLVLVRATPEGHDEVARFSAIEGKTWNVPAIADGRLLVRNARQMAAFDLRPGT